MLSDRDTRRTTSIGLDLVVWQHARRRLGVAPQTRFLRRFEPSDRWTDGAAPPAGLPRAAVLYHLPSGGDPLGPTPAELLARSPLFPRLCHAEREWLDAQRHARFSFFRVERLETGGVTLRDWFAELSGRGDVLVARGEIDRPDLALGHTVFARVVPFRRRYFVDLLQAVTSREARIADPAAPALDVWRSGHALRTRGGMVTALFEAWSRPGEARGGP